MPRQEIRSRTAVSVNVRSQRDFEERPCRAMARSLTPIRLICYGTDGWGVRRSRWWVTAMSVLPWHSDSPSEATPTLCWSTSWKGFFFQAEDGIRDLTVTGVQTCALPI